MKCRGCILGRAILVTSGKGGTGKTTLTAGLSSCLAALGRKVVCVDADIGLRNLDLVLGLSDRVALDFCDVLSGAATLEQALYPHPQIKGLFLLAAPTETRAEQVDAALFAEMIGVLKQACDYCFVDSPAGLGAGFSLAAGACDQALIVSSLEQPSLRDAARAVDLMDKLGIAPIQLVINRVRPNLLGKRGAFNVDDAMDMVGLPLVGIVPEDAAVIAAANKGLPLVLFGRSGASHAFHSIAKRLEGQQVPLKLKKLKAVFRARIK